MTGLYLQSSLCVERVNQEKVGDTQGVAVSCEWMLQRLDTANETIATVMEQSSVIQQETGQFFTDSEHFICEYYMYSLLIFCSVKYNH